MGFTSMGYVIMLSLRVDNSFYVMKRLSQFIRLINQLIIVELLETCESASDESTSFQCLRLLGPPQ